MVANDIKALMMHLNDFCSMALQNAIGYCVSRSHYEITVEHLLFKILEDKNSDLGIMLTSFDIDVGRIQKAIIHTLEEYKQGNSAKPVFSPLLLDLIQDAWVISSIDLAEKRVRSGGIFLAFLARVGYYSIGYYADLFRDIDHRNLLHKFSQLTLSSIENIQQNNAEIENPAAEFDKRSILAGNEGFLKRFCTDFTQLASDGHIDPVFGRDEELRLVIEILARRRKNNPICVGDPGVGKTSIVEGLALSVINDTVPDFLKGVRLLGLDMGALEAGTGVKGEFEARLRGIINEIKASSQKIILFVDEAHMLVAPGGGNDAANLLKPLLARGELRTIAATTWKEYKKYFEKDPALTRRFQLIKMDEPSVETTILILRGIKQRYEQAHQIVIRNDAIELAAKLSDRYITDRFLPDKAIDLLDTSCARIKINLTAKPARLADKEHSITALERAIIALERDRLNGVEIDEAKYSTLVNQKIQLADEAFSLQQRWLNEKNTAYAMLDIRNQLANDNQSKQELTKLTKNLKILETKLLTEQGDDPLIKIEVDPDTVAEVVADWTGIPLGKMQRDESSLLINLEQRLQEKIQGQDSALTIIADSIRAAKLGLKNPQQPLGVFLFVGPSGTGKTETGLSLAEVFFGSSKSIITINMSEFQESHTVSRLVGSPPGYVGYGEGGMLTEAVRQNPYSVILLDEVEKAHIDVLNVFYQIFDKGIANDGEGKEINFQNTIIILTSNLASDIIQEMTANLEEARGLSTSNIFAAINPILSQHFKPALLARMTVVPFYSLQAKAMAKIVEHKMAKIQQRLLENNKMVLSYTPEVLDTIIERCIEVESGARNIDFLLNSNILPKLSRNILAQTSTCGLPSTVHIKVAEDGNFNFEFTNNSKEEIKVAKKSEKKLLKKKI